MDIVTPARRSMMMSRIGGKNTAPEMKVRRAAHSLGHRFRLHRREMPGSPDLVFPRKKVALFVHGCFWHRHEGCRRCYAPKSNVEFWEQKFHNNVTRDKRVTGELERMGWSVFVIWECETASADELNQKLQKVLG